MKPFFAVAILFCAITSCNDKDSDPPKVITIDGYTPTDHLGNPMGTVDATDWTVNETWNDQETSIFSTISAGNLAGTSAGTITMYPAYPNPCAHSFGMVVNSSTACKIRFALVDDRLRTHHFGILPLSAGFNNLAVTPDAAIPNGLYRVYYAFDAQGSPMFMKGHGDVMLQ